jgi:hypothetical protein
VDTTGVPVLTLTVANFNPNHKYRFLLLMPLLRWFVDLAFAGRDDSIYIVPHLQQVYTLAGSDSGGVPFEAVVDPTQGLHLSLHHSGTVNLTIRDRRFKIRQQPPEAFHGRLVTLGVKNPDGLRPTTEHEVNSLPGRYSVLPVAGFLAIGPVYLTIFRVPTSGPWKMPKLSDTLQMHFECLLRRRDVKYEFVVWQNATIPAWPGNLAISV